MWSRLRPLCQRSNVDMVGTPRVRKAREARRARAAPPPRIIFICRSQEAGKGGPAAAAEEESTKPGMHGPTWIGVGWIGLGLISILANRPCINIVSSGSLAFFRTFCGSVGPCDRLFPFSGSCACVCVPLSVFQPFFFNPGTPHHNQNHQLPATRSARALTQTVVGPPADTTTHGGPSVGNRAARAGWCVADDGGAAAAGGRCCCCCCCDEGAPWFRGPG